MIKITTHLVKLLNIYMRLKENLCVFIQFHTVFIWLLIRFPRQFLTKMSTGQGYIKDQSYSGLHFAIFQILAKLFIEFLRWLFFLNQEPNITIATFEIYFIDWRFCSLVCEELNMAIDFSEVFQPPPGNQTMFLHGMNNCN